MDKFEIEDKQFFIKTTPEIIREAGKIRSKAFNDALQSGAILRQALMKYMEKQGLWGDEKENEYQIYAKKISTLEQKLSAGGIKISEGRAIAIELSRVRADFRDLLSERSTLDANTVEGIADNARFNFLLAKSVYSYDTQKLVFSSLEDYLEKGSETLSMQIAAKFANYLYGVDENYETNLVENKFLKRFNLINSDGRFIDDQGRFVDVDGNLVTEEGIKIDEVQNIVSTTVDTAEFSEG